MDSIRNGPFHDHSTWNPWSPWYNELAAVPANIHSMDSTWIPYGFTQWKSVHFNRHVWRLSKTMEDCLPPPFFPFCPLMLTAPKQLPLFMINQHEEHSGFFFGQGFRHWCKGWGQDWTGTQIHNFFSASLHTFWTDEQPQGTSDSLVMSHNP